MSSKTYYNYYGVPNKYYWIYVMGGINSFADASGIGANDMANSFGTVYGSKVMNKWQIVAVAAVCEFTGSMALGKGVAKTIAAGIASQNLFKFNPYCLMWGFLSALAASTTWLYVATWQKLPVSTTHSIVGGVIGFCIAFGGTEAVIWNAPIPEFPFISGVVVIVLSWITSPVFCAILSMILYGSIKMLILGGDNAPNKAAYSLPIFVGITFFVEAFLIITKGANEVINWTKDISHVAWVSAVIGAIAAVLSIPLVPLMIKWRKQEDDRVATGTDRVFATEITLNVREGNCLSYAWQEFWRSPYNVHADMLAKKAHDLEVNGVNPSLPEDEVDRAAKKPKEHVMNPDDFEDYSPGAEYVFRYLQVFTAMCASFAHGSNDVANAAGPYSGIVSIYNTGFVPPKNVNVERWVLAMCAAGIVFGLATYGKKILELLGTDLTYITPVRGFSAELSAAWVVSLCSAYGMPVSTTQCITGAIIGVALLDVPIWKLQWRIIGKIFTSWLFTIVLVGMGSAALFSVGLHTPVKYAGPNTQNPH